jgi:hypothetical protein
MKIKVYVIDVRLPRWVRRVLVFGAVPLAILGLGALVYASAVNGQPDFNDGDVLTAAALNAHLGALQGQINTVNQNLSGITVSSNTKGITTSWVTVFTVATTLNEGFAAQFVVTFVKTNIGYGSVMMNCLAMNKGDGTAFVNSYNTQYAYMDTEVQLQAIASGTDVLFQARVNPTYPATGSVNAVLFAQGNHASVVKD